MKRILLAAMAMMAVITLAAGCKSKSAQNAKQNPADSTDVIKVMSFNIRMMPADDGENSWDLRKPAVAAMLDDVNPDVFGIQEAFPGQVSFITKNCPRYVSYGLGRDDGVDEGEHMSIFYNSEKVEMLEHGTYWLSETPDEVSYGWDAACRRTATWALMKMKGNGKEFYYVNTHLDHVGVQARINGLALIVNKIGDMNKDGAPMVLTGDFNVQPDDSCLVDLNKIMLSARDNAELSDPLGSYQGFGTCEPQIIDYIYYSDFAKCLTFKVISEQYADRPYISDHYPVVAELEFD